MPGVCGRCQKNVYFAEEKIAVGKSWHKLCFNCATCRKMLDSTTATEYKDELFCKSCYSRKFGPKGYGYGYGKGYGYGRGAGVLNMDDGSGYKNGPVTSNVPHLAQAYIAPLLGPPAPKPTGPKKVGGADLCGRCGKAVYMAEKMMGGGKPWHISCFVCTGCSKHLESTTLCVREGKLYCRTCYGKNYGPKGYGHRGIIHRGITS